MSSSNGNNEEEEDYCFHPESKWEEPYSDLVLTLYDLHRIPRPVKDAKLRLTVPLKHLNSEFVCPICLGYMRKTSMVMECLHRFCNECIQKCLRIGKKECPSCRIHIPSRRSLRLDPEFDSLILHILGDVKVLEENEEKEAQLAVNRNKSYLLSRKRRSEEELESRTSSKKTRSEAEEVDEGDEEDVGGSEDRAEGPMFPETNLKHIEPSPLLDFVLVRHYAETRMPKLKKDWLTINGEASIRILKRYLHSKLPYDGDLMIMAEENGKCVSLEDSRTLNDIQKSFYRDEGDDAMILYYRGSRR